MTAALLKEEVKKILCDRLKLESVRDDARQEDYAEWDSMTYLSVVSALEEKYGLTITPENIECFSNIEGIIKQVQNALDHR